MERNLILEIIDRPTVTMDAGKLELKKKCGKGTLQSRGGQKDTFF